MITITGGTKKQREIVDELYGFCIDELIPEKLYDINVQITLVNKIKRINVLDALDPVDELNKLRGLCAIDDSGKCRIYEMEINKNQSIDRFVETVIHETAHIFQYESGLLIDIIHKPFWKGKDYTGVSYSKEPWERQANRIVTKLKPKYLEWHEEVWNKKLK